MDKHCRIEQSTIIRHLIFLLLSTFNDWWHTDMVYNILISIQIRAENEIFGRTTMANHALGTKITLFC